MSVLAGIHAIKHAFEAGQAVDELLIEKGKRHPRLNELIHLAKKAGVQVSFVPREGAVAECPVAGDDVTGVVSFEDWLKTLDMETKPLVLLLDQVTDPHNLGACARTAEAAGCVALLVPKDNAADLRSPVASKAACGALARLPVYRVANLSRTIEKLQDKGFWTVGMAGEADASIYETVLDGSLAVVMGSEGKGIRRLVRETCDQLIKIPMPGFVESLNVSVATGVTLFEISRQRFKS